MAFIAVAASLVGCGGGDTENIEAGPAIPRKYT